jgi:hypothetical protein
MEPSGIVVAQRDIAFIGSMRTARMAAQCGESKKPPNFLAGVGELPSRRICVAQIVRYLVLLTNRVRERTA